MSYWENCAGMACTWQWLSAQSFASYQEAMDNGNIKRAISHQKTVAKDAATARAYLWLAINKTEIRLETEAAS